jgi:hypothetical protein
MALTTLPCASALACDTGKSEKKNFFFGRCPRSDTPDQLWLRVRSSGDPTGPPPGVTTLNETLIMGTRVPEHWLFPHALDKRDGIADVPPIFLRQV